MKIGIYIGSSALENDPRFVRLSDELLKGGCILYRVHDKADLGNDTEMLMSVGGDGTYLTAAMMVAGTTIPVVGVNLGRVGFLSENRPDVVAGSILAGQYTVEDSTLLSTSDGILALNEMTIHRSGASILGLDVAIDGVPLPTYWADGIIVSTSSGSTAYSLSSGGPIVVPEAKVLIITPISPHNLNVRPLVIPDTSKVSIRMRSRDPKVVFTADNRPVEMGADSQIDIAVARFSLKRVRFNNSDFINALTEKLHWGEDIRNN